MTKKSVGQGRRTAPQRLAATEGLFRTHSDAMTAHSQALQLIYAQVVQQASLWSFVDNFRLFGVLCLVCVPLILLFKRVQRGQKPIAAH